MKNIWIAALMVGAASLEMSAGALAADQAAASNAAQPAVPSYAERLDRGKQIASAVCLACHGADGVSPTSANPNLAGMPAEYIAKQLELFKSGKRANAIMMGMSANLTPADMKVVGDFYFAQRGKSQAVARDLKIAERGQQIYRVGIPDAKIPACAGCHGGAGDGLPAIYPRVRGQWPEYSLSQLKAYASGERKNTQMNAIAARMNSADLVAVSEYMAGMRTR